MGCTLCSAQAFLVVFDLKYDASSNSIFPKITSGTRVFISVKMDLSCMVTFLRLVMNLMKGILLAMSNTRR